MSRNAPLVMGMCLLGACAGFVLHQAYWAIMAGEPAAVTKIIVNGVLAAVDGFISCLLFAFMWQVCRYDRDHLDRDREDFDL
jgi:hypothetical protein